MHGLAQDDCFGLDACPDGVGYSCVDTDWDDDNCGYCGNSCTAGTWCSRGRCEATDSGLEVTLDCQSYEELCPASFGSYVCSDLDWDNNNCGRCGAVCPGGSSCVSGECFCNDGDLCPTSSGGTQCIDTSFDRQNCGACGTACQSGFDCVAGRCRESAAVSAPTTTVVPFGLESVTDRDLTESRFAALLPRSFPGHELVTDVPPEESTKSLYEGMARSRTYYYADPARSTPTVVAMANVSTFKKGTSPNHFIIEQHEACDSVDRCKVLSENVSLDASVVFQLKETLVSNRNTPSYALIWGDSAGPLVFTLLAESQSGLENLAYGLVNNADT